VRVLRWLAIALAALVAGVGLVAIGARFADGPIAMLPGGPFRTGEWVEDPHVDWSFAADTREIELQSGDPVRSRTTWILVVDGEAYIPCSLSFPPGKTWHREALENPDAVVRVGGKRYRRRLVKVDDPALEQRLRETARAKYEPPPGSGGGVWFFHLAPPLGTQVGFADLRSGTATLRVARLQVHEPSRNTLRAIVLSCMKVVPS
jgi:hypothetical protein